MRHPRARRLHPDPPDRRRLSVHVPHGVGIRPRRRPLGGGRLHLEHDRQHRRIACLLVRGAPRLRAVAAGPALVALVVWILPSWDEQVLASGAYLYGDAYAAAARALRIDLQTYLRKESTIVARYWDAYGLTTVHKSEDGNLSIRVNGKADASTGTADMPTQRTVGNLGMLHHPAPRRALVIGLGS